MNRTLAVTVILLSSITASAQEARREFESCVRCHQPPDLRFDTDRAWLDQVHRTA